MNKIEKAIMLKFLNYVAVTTNWFVRGWEKKYTNEVDQEELNELKSLIKRLEEYRDELEHEK